MIVKEYEHWFFFKEKDYIQDTFILDYDCERLWQQIYLKVYIQDTWIELINSDLYTMCETQRMCFRTRIISQVE